MRSILDTPEGRAGTGQARPLRPVVPCASATRPRGGNSHETNAKGSLRPWRSFHGQVGVAGSEAARRKRRDPAHSVSDGYGALYHKMIPVLVADGLRELAPDLVGFGRSEKPTRREDYTYNRQVA